jgi:hypothetical protein
VLTIRFRDPAKKKAATNGKPSGVRGLMHTEILKIHQFEGKKTPFLAFPPDIFGRN